MHLEKKKSKAWDKNLLNLLVFHVFGLPKGKILHVMVDSFYTAVLTL